jgi:hypothetical protein
VKLKRVQFQFRLRLSQKFWELYALRLYVYGPCVGISVCYINVRDACLDTRRNDYNKPAF